MNNPIQALAQMTMKPGHSFLMNWSDWLCEECLL